MVVVVVVVVRRVRMALVLVWNSPSAAVARPAGAVPRNRALAVNKQEAPLLRCAKPHRLPNIANVTTTANTARCPSFCFPPPRPALLYTATMSYNPRMSMARTTSHTQRARPVEEPDAFMTLVRTAVRPSPCQMLTMLPARRRDRRLHH